MPAGSLAKGVDRLLDAGKGGLDGLRDHEWPLGILRHWLVEDVEYHGEFEEDHGEDLSGRITGDQRPF